MIATSKHEHNERAARLRGQRIQRIVSSVILGGSLVTAGAILWSEPGQPVPLATQAAPPPAAPAAPAEPAPEPPAALEVSEETKVESQPIVVALAHEDSETDFAARAREEIDRGALESAFVSLRHHLFKAEPTAELLIELGSIGRQIGEHAIAEQALLDAAALDPTNAASRVELARVQLEVGELPEARTSIRQALRLEPDSAAAWNVAGRVAMEESAWPRAEHALRRAVELDPTGAMTHNNLGLLYIKMRRAADAVDSLETAVELFGDDVPYFVYNNLGLAYEQNGTLELAEEAFEEALLANPDYARAKVNLDRVLGAIAQTEEQRGYDTAQGSSLEQQEKPAL